MTLRETMVFIKGKYVDPQYVFRDRLYFLFGTAGLISAGAAFIAAVGSGLPRIAAAASLMSFFIMLVLMVISFFVKDVTVNRIVCSIFLNFFMFPALFWVTGGVNCGMVFYFILGLSVAALILDGPGRIVVLVLALIFDIINLYLGFKYPELAYPLSYEERSMDIISSFAIVAVFIIAVIFIMSIEYQREHDKVLENIEKLNKQATTDSLTKLYNHRFFSEALEHMAEACSLKLDRASVILFDLDDFKKINDTYGHLRGNQVLSRFAAILKEKSGEKYIAARYGGEEFIIAMPGCGKEAAQQFAEMIRLDVIHDKRLTELTEGTFSVSGGVVEYQAGMSAEEWVRQADANLYTAKENGKNKIVG